MFSSLKFALYLKKSLVPTNFEVYL